MLKAVDSVNLELIAHIASDDIDYSPLTSRGWIPMRMKIRAFGSDGVPMDVWIYCDPETQTTIARHE